MSKKLNSGETLDQHGFQVTEAAVERMNLPFLDVHFRQAKPSLRRHESVERVNSPAGLVADSAVGEQCLDSFAGETELSAERLLDAGQDGVGPQEREPNLGDEPRDHGIGRRPRVVVAHHVVPAGVRAYLSFRDPVAGEGDNVRVVEVEAGEFGVVEKILQRCVHAVALPSSQPCRRVPLLLGQDDGLLVHRLDVGYSRQNAMPSHAAAEAHADYRSHSLMRGSRLNIANKSGDVFFFEWEAYQ